MKIFCLIILSISFYHLYGQSTENYLAIDGVEYIGNPTPIERKIPYSRIQGSPYHQNKLISGSLIMTNHDSLRRFMRFNAFTNEIEYVENEVIKVLLNPFNIDRIHLNGLTYQYTRYQSGNGLKESWMILKVEGKCSLYQRKLVEFRDEEAAESSYQTGSPAKFVNLPVQYFATCDGEEIVPIALNKTSINSFFGSDGEFVEDLMKKNKLKPRKEEDLVRLFSIINEGR